MGKSNLAVLEADQRIKQLTENIEGRKYFELGDDPAALEEMEKGIVGIQESLGRLEQFFSSKSQAEKNYYFESIRAANRAAGFLETVRGSRSGSPENTAQFLRYLHSLRVAVIRLADGKAQEEYQIDPDLPEKQETEPQDTIKEKHKNSTHLRHPRYEGSIFISYAWGDKREEIVNQIDEALQERGIKIVRDKRDLPYKGSIQKFMEQIGRANCIVVVISDKYLRSRNCMFELVEIAANKQFAERIFPIILSDAKIYDPYERIDYVEFWEKEQAKLNERMKSLSDQSNLRGIREELDNYDRFRDEISELTSTLKDMNALTPEMHQETNFSDLYGAIEKRMTRKWQP